LSSNSSTLRRQEEEAHARLHTREALSEWKVARQQEAEAAQAAARAGKAAAQAAAQERLRARQELNALKLREYHEHKARCWALGRVLRFVYTQLGTAHR